MTIFILACGGLVLLSGLFYLFPPRRDSGGAELERANLEWYRLRRRELADSGDQALDDDARLRLLEEQLAGERGSPTSLAETRRFLAWPLLPLVAIVAGVLYYYLGAAPDVLLNTRMQQVNENTPADDIRALMADVEKRSAQRPDNLYYRAMLAR
ncbi:MAG: hypothetical protein ACK5HY_13675 [Parahaliea sp.]